MSVVPDVPLNDALFVCALIVFWLCVAVSIATTARSMRGIVADLIGVGVAAWLAVEYAGVFALWSGVAACALLLIYVAVFGFARPSAK